MRTSRKRAQASLFAIVVPCVAPLVSSAARAGDRPFALQWTAPAGCPGGAAVEAEITRLLGDQSSSSTGTLRAAGTITPVDGGFALNIELSRDGWQSARSVRGATCRALADAGALIVAMAIDPEAATRSGAATTDDRPGAGARSSNPAPEPGAAARSSNPAPEPGAAARSSNPAPEPGAAAARGVNPALEPGAAAARGAEPGRTRTPPEAVLPPSGRERTAEGASGRAPLFRVGLGAVGDVGTMQHPSGAIEPWAAVIVGPARLEAGASFWPGQAAESATNPRSGGTIGLVAGSLTACALVPPLARAVRPHFEVGVPCAGFELGRMYAEGYGVSDPDEGSLLWAALRGGATAAWVVAPWMRLRLRLEAAVPLKPPRFVLGGVGEVHAPGVAARAALGIELAP